MLHSCHPPNEMTTSIWRNLLRQMGSGPRGIMDHAGPFRTLGIKQPQNSIVPTTWQFSVWFEDFKNISPLLRIYSSLPRQVLLLRLEIRNPPRLILTGHVYHDMTCGGGGGGWKLKVIQVRSKARRGQKGQRKNEHALNSAERRALRPGSTSLLFSCGPRTTAWAPPGGLWKMQNLGLYPGPRASESAL